MKHVPQRTCIVCREMRPKRELVRVVRQPDGVILVDESGKANGRGAYVCRRFQCWQQALAGKGSRRAARLAAALKADVSDEDAATLMEYAAALSMPKDETSGASN